MMVVAFGFGEILAAVWVNIEQYDQAENTSFAAGINKLCCNFIRACTAQEKMFEQSFFFLQMFLRQRHDHQNLATAPVHTHEQV